MYNSTRRRLMMANKKTLPQGCIFYAPLSQYDLTDSVSGANLISTGKFSMQWDAVENMWFIEAINDVAGSCGFYWDVDFTNDFNFTMSDEYTIIASVKVPNTQSGRPYIAGLGNFDSSSSYKPCISSSFGTNGKVAFIKKNISPTQNLLTFYYSGATETQGTNHLSNTANWNNTNLCAKRVCIGVVRETGYYNVNKLYIKDVYVFNRALTTNEIAAL